MRQKLDPANLLTSFRAGSLYRRSSEMVVRIHSSLPPSSHFPSPPQTSTQNPL